MIYTLTKTITAAGTAEKLSATSIPCAWAMIYPLPTNTTDGYIGDSNVSSTRGACVPKYTAGANNFVYLPPLGNVQRAYDLNQIYGDVATNGQGFRVIYYKM